ncbi:MAG TPA: DUF488 family protein [Nitrospirales bacterium]|nr:DUF488 family protein [Nitrospirales bacterium]HIN33888.1 DUF488 family protein [Nitrospirales bacterium]
MRVKRVYETPNAADGTRILVNRLWPRGLSKERAKINYWAKTIAPSAELRQWYGHDPEKWEQFTAKYAAELDSNAESITELLVHFNDKHVTLLFSSREARLNNVYALKEYFEASRSV